MGNSFQIGKIFGISIRIDYSWFVIFALVIFLFGVDYFPKQYSNWSDEYPRWSPALYWLMGTITALLFFASVLIHELAHSLVSRARGVPVNNITLFILGGVSQLSDEPKSPGGEFWMALAGPATSIGIGAIALGLYMATGRAQTPPAALFKLLARVNLVVAIFNLVPGFPLDGGRILRSIVWKITGNLRKATRAASIIGRTFAYLLIVLGVRILLSGNLLNGIWFIFSGWFLEKAASSSYRQLAVREMLQGVKVSDVMVSDCLQIPGSVTVRELVDEYVVKTAYRCFPIVDGGNVLGIVDLHSASNVPREQWNTIRVEEIMTPFDELIAVHPDDELYAVMQQMTEERVDQLPVVKDGQLMGMIARDNLVDFIHTR